MKDDFEKFLDDIEEPDANSVFRTIKNGDSFYDDEGYCPHCNSHLVKDYNRHYCGNCGGEVNYKGCRERKSK